MALGWALALKVGAGLAPGSSGAVMAGALRRVRYFRQRDSHGAEPAAAAAARRRAYRGEPAAASLAWKFAQIERYGFMILIVLLFTGALGIILWPLINLSISGIGAFVRFCSRGSVPVDQGIVEKRGTGVYVR